MDITKEKKEARDIQKKGNSKIYDENVIRAVVFRMAGREHAVDVQQVREILMYRDSSPVVGAPDFIEGVINLRGRIIPIVNLNKRLYFPEIEKTCRTCIIVGRIGKKLVGFVVDSASELLHIPLRLIETPSGIVGGIQTPYIQGVAYLEDRFIVLLNLDKIFTLYEKEILEAGIIPEEEKHHG